VAFQEALTSALCKLPSSSRLDLHLTDCKPSRLLHLDFQVPRRSITCDSLRLALVDLNIGRAFRSIGIDGEASQSLTTAIGTVGHLHLFDCLRRTEVDIPPRVCFVVSVCAAVSTPISVTVAIDGTRSWRIVAVRRLGGSHPGHLQPLRRVSSVIAVCSFLLYVAGLVDVAPATRGMEGNEVASPR